MKYDTGVALAKERRYCVECGNECSTTIGWHRGYLTFECVRGHQSYTKSKFTLKGWKEYYTKKGTAV